MYLYIIIWLITTFALIVLDYVIDDTVEIGDVLLDLAFGMVWPAVIAYGLGSTMFIFIILPSARRIGFYIRGQIQKYKAHKRGDAFEEPR